jgi:septin family protein
MTRNTYQLSLDFEQILTLVKQLTEAEKEKLKQEIEKDLLAQELKGFFEEFKTDELDLETITEAVEEVRAEMYAKGQQYG